MNDRLEILYQDQWIAVVFKPAGMLSVPYSGSKGKTAQSVLEEILRKQGKANGKHKPFAVHRLDRDTSGVMMFALTEQARTKIMDSWHKMVSERLYRAVAENPLNKKMILPDSGLIDDPLAMNAYNVGYVPKGDRDSKGNLIQTVAARTHYSVVKRGETHTLFQLSLDTGKKNQIRAHLAGRGYPLSGDLEHRGHENPFGRLCLHARSLKFKHPFTGEELGFEVEEPEEWSRYVERGDFKLLKEKKGASHGAGGAGAGKNRGRNNGGSSRKDDDFGRLSQNDRNLTRKQTAHMNFIEKGQKHR